MDSIKESNEIRLLLSLSWLGMILMTITMCLKPVYNLYYLAPQIIMLLTTISSATLIGRDFKASSYKQYSLNMKWSLMVIFSIIIFILGNLYIKPPLLEAKSPSTKFLMKNFSPHFQSIKRSFTRKEATIILHLLCIQPEYLSCLIAASIIGKPVNPFPQDLNQSDLFCHGKFNHFFLYGPFSSSGKLMRTF